MPKYGIVQKLWIVLQSTECLELKALFEPVSVKYVGGKTSILRHSIRLFWRFSGAEKNGISFRTLGSSQHPEVTVWALNCWPDCALKTNTPRHNLCDGNSPLNLLMSGVSVIGKGGGSCWKTEYFSGSPWCLHWKVFRLNPRTDYSPCICLYSVFWVAKFLYGQAYQISGGGTKDH